MYANSLGHVMALNLAESTSAPGEGRLIAASYYTAGDEGTATFVSYTKALTISRATTRRFPDLVNVKSDTFGVPSQQHATSDTLYGEAIDWVEQWEVSGGYFAAWDVPALLERLAKVGAPSPSRVVDLKVLDRLLFPRHRGRRDLASLAELVGVRQGPVVGLVDEVEVVGEVAERIIDSVDAGDRMTRKLGSTWGSIMRAQSAAYKHQMVGLVEWMVRQGRDPSGLRAGWPTWG